MIVIPKEEWGSLPTVVPQTKDAKSEVYVHHVAGRWPTSPADEEAHMRELQAYAINTKHYVDLDYNVLIGPSGLCYEGRGYFGMAAATKDRNAVSRAVCLMGNLDTREPSQAQLDALPLLLADMIAAGSLMARVAVLGHYENPAHPGATACPGRFMKPHLPGVRARLAALLHPTLPPLPTPEDDDMTPYFIATAPGRGSATLRIGDQVTMVGLSGPSDVAAARAALKAEDWPMSDQQFDGFADQATWKRP